MKRTAGHRENDVGEFAKTRTNGVCAKQGFSAFRWMAGMGLCLVVAGCGGSAGSVGDTSDSMTTKFGNLLAFNSSKAPSLDKQRKQNFLYCAVVQTDPGASYHRVGGESNASVRYQISVGDVARECMLENGQVMTKVGVEIRTVLGPAGSPGTYSTPLTISMRRITDEKIVTSKTYTVGGRVDDGGAALSQLVSDPLIVPYINDHVDEDYEVILSFGNGVSASSGKRGRR